ncbi:MAG: undecaprenyl-phosphate glucose phosphotransferase, partial [Gammaproteobacteria bacterium]
ERFIAEQGIDMVFLALPMHAANRIKEVFEACQQTTVSVMLVPDLFMFELRDARLQDIAGMPVFALCETPFWGVHGVAKRIEDLFLASLSLLCLWPLLLLIAIGVKMSSPGPVLFRQRRHGLDDKVFYVYKFRTMTVCEDDGNIQQAQRDDPRVTRFGAFLRKTSLDELPQLFNVLKGEMSLVGPRPHALAHNEEYKQLINRYVWRHKVRPGLTGWAQVNGWRGETDTLEKMQKRVEHDLWYIANWSIWLDIRILLMTVWIVLSRKNAY